MSSRRVALVTGANRGIGLEVCRQLAAASFDVVLGSRDSAKGELAAAELGEPVISLQLDVADDEVRRGFETNLLGAWRMTQAFLPLLRRGESARIVNVSSEAGSLSSMGGGTPIYSTSKAALNALTRILAAELRSDGILVNAVCPGWTATDMGGPGGRDVADGAASVVWGATLPDDGPTGGFFRDGEPRPW
jgi:NAD(P)-dependent dehydrogenase (short-subunit alcohol dehydrogenase family)